MPIPTSISDLSTTAASNSPQGSESPTEGDNYIRALSSIIKTQDNVRAQFQTDVADTASASNGAGMVGLDFYGGTLRAFLATRYARTAAEVAVSVTPSNYAYPPGDVRRYGALLNGVADDTTAWRNAVLVAEYSTDPATHGSNSPARGIGVVFAPSGYSLITDEIPVTKSILVLGEGPTEFSGGTRLVQTVANKNTFKVTPIAQGCTFQMDSISLLSNASGTGHLVQVVRGSGGSTCNSQRYRNCIFGTPQFHSLKIEAGDDILIDGCLFDVSAAGCIWLGTSTAADVVSNIRINGGNFFDIDVRCILVENVAGLSVNGAVVYSAGAGRTQFFIDAYTLTPYQARDISINGGTFGLGSNTSGVDCLVKANAVQGLSVQGICAINAGLAASSARSFIELTGTCQGIAINGNKVTGAFGTLNFYNDAAGTITSANITGNTFIATSGAGQAISAANTTFSVIGGNTLIGFASACVGGKFTTTGNVFAPGTVNGSSVNTTTYTVTGALIGDKVEIRPVTGAWPVANNVFPQGLITAANTVTVRYSNPTSVNAPVAAHDWILEVSR
jgi:hypothetical protein